MSTRELKTLLQNHIDKANDKVLMMALALFESEQQAEAGDWWNELTKEQEREIRKGLADLEAGRYIRFDEFMAQLR